MSGPAPVDSSSVAPSSTDPSTAGNVATTQGAGEVTGLTKVTSLGDLKEKAPKVYNMMMLGIAVSMINKMHEQDERLKQLWREARYND